MTVMLQPTPSFSGPNNSYETIHLLAQASDLLTNCSNYDAMIESIAKLLVTSLASWCTIDLISDKGEIERVAAAHRQPEKAGAIKLLLNKYPPRPTAKRGVYRVIESGQPIMVPHLTRADWAPRAESEEHLNLIMDLGSSTYMCVPLIVSGRVVGAIMLLSSERTYGEQDLQTAERIASKISMAVDNVSMFRKMQATINELESTQRQLIQSTKLSALGTVCAGIAHEINNPLTVVRLHLENLENVLDAYNIQDSSVRRYVEKANSNVDRIVKIVSNVKTFSRQSDLSFKTVNIPSIIESSLALFEEQFLVQQIHVEKKFPQEPIFSNGDASSLQQVFVNILSNAKDAIKAKRTIGGKIQIEVTTENNKIQIDISDTGVGAKPEIKDRVFEPFFTTKAGNQGTGLGLSISHGIITSHKGEISFDSSEGNGARVRICLPAPQH